MKTATMKKARLLTVLLAVVMALAIFGVLSLTVNAAEAADDLTVTMGTESVVLEDTDGNGFYEIDSVEKLYAFAAAVNGGNATINGELTQDITVNTNVLAVALNDQSTDGIRVWTPIGKDKDFAFEGNFNGNGHTISGLYYEESADRYIGLFGYVVENDSKDNVIQNVGVMDSYFHANRYVGAVVGYNEATVRNCYNKNSAVFGNQNSVGGVIGCNEGTIEDCYNTGTVDGDNDIGGIVGENEGVVTRCYNKGDVSGNNSVGGIVGDNIGIVKVCYNMGSIKANRFVGGIIGDNSGDVFSCYNIGALKCEDDYIGGIVGNNVKGSKVEICYYLDTCVDTQGNTKTVVYEGTAKSDKAFKSGEVTYLLNNKVSEGALNWYQLITILNEKNEVVVEGEDYPQFYEKDGRIVYNHPKEVGTQFEYSNHAHDWKFKLVDNVLTLFCDNNDDGSCHWHNGNGGTLTLIDPSKTYDEKAIDAKYEYSEEWYIDEITMTITHYDVDGNLLNAAPVNVGSYTAKATYVFGEESFTLVTDYKINPRLIKPEDLTLSKNEGMYNRNPHEFDITVEVDGFKPVAGVDYIIIYKKDGVVVDQNDAEAMKNAFTNVGELTVIIEGIGNYYTDEPVEDTYTITKPVITDDDIFVSGDMFYDSVEHKPEITVVVNGLTLVKDVDYTVKFYRNDFRTIDFTNAGEITIVVTGINNYGGGGEKIYTIERVEIIDRDRFDDDVHVDGFATYNGKNQIPNVMVTIRRLTLVEGRDYTVKFERNGVEITDFKRGFIQEGTITVTITGIGNYKGTVTMDYVIQRATVDLDDVTIFDDVIYNQAEQKTDVTVKVDRLTLVPGRDYTVTFKRGDEVTDDFTNTGVITVIVEGIGNYIGTVEKTYEIIKPKITDPDVSVSGDMIYDAQEHKPVITVKVNGLALVLDRDYTVTFKRGDEVTDDFTNAGTITITIEGKDNYFGTVTKTYVIERVEIVDNERFDDDVYVDGFTNFNGSAQMPTVMVTIRRLTLVEDRDFTVTYFRDGENGLEETEDFTNVGTIYVKITGIGNYYGSVTMEYVILPAKLNLDDADISEDTVYNTQEQKPDVVVTFEALNGTVTLVKDRDYTVKFERNGVETDDFTNAGVITIIIEGIGNYQGTVTKYYVIDKAQLTLDLISPVDVVCPGNKLLLAVISNSSELSVPSFNNEMFGGRVNFGDETNKELLISVSDNFVFGRDGDTITITVYYAETANYYANSTSITLEVRDCDCEEARAELEAAIKALMNAADANLQDQIDVLKNAIDELNKAHEEDVNELKDAVAKAIENAKIDLENAITALEVKLNNAVTNLQNQINTNNGSIVEIQKAIIEIQGLIKVLNVADATNKEELEQAIADAKAELENAISDLEGRLEDAVEDLQNQINTNNGNIVEIQKAIIEIQGLIKVLNVADTANKEELVSKIEAAETALNAAIEELKGRVTAVEKDIADIFTLLEASGIDIGKINTTLGNINDTLEALAKADEALGGQLSEAINNAKSELNAAKAELKALIDAVQANLDKAVEDLNKAIANGDKVLDDKIAALDKALADAKAALEATHAADVKALTEKIETADAALDAAIKAVQKNLDDAKAELNAAIANGDKALNDKITALNKALADAKAALEATGAADKTELVSKIETANAALEAAIAAVQKNLDDAKAELNAAIANGDKALDDKITALNAALDAAKAALEATDAADKAELVSKIETADAALDAAIKAVQKNLDDAKTELNAAIANGDKALDDKIAALNAALDAAKAALEATDAADKAELVSKIEAADAALQAAIDALSAELGNVKNELENLKNELANLKNELSNAKTEIETTKTEGEKSDNQVQTVATVAAVTSGVTLVGGAAAAIWLLISKKRLF